MLILGALVLLLVMFPPWKWEKTTSKRWSPEEGLRKYRKGWKGLP